MSSFFLSVCPRVQIEYGDLLRKSPYLVRLRENTDQENVHIWALFTLSCSYLQEFHLGQPHQRPHIFQQREFHSRKPTHTK